MCIDFEEIPKLEKKFKKSHFYGFGGSSELFWLDLWQFRVNHCRESMATQYTSQHNMNEIIENSLNPAHVSSKHGIPSFWMNGCA